jgi:DNA-binding transcriptional ArsR family regulator
MAKTVSLEQEARQVVETACAQMIDCPCGCNREATTALFSEMPDEELLFDVADLFKAFSDTTRIKILFALMGGPSSVTGITEAISCTQSAVSHQLRTLKQARLVKAARDGKNVIYSLSDDHVFTMLAQGITHVCE